jgi:hypothetical protein
MAVGTAAVIGWLFDATMGGIAVASAFQEFRKGRPADETEDEARAEFVKEMISQMKGEAAADASIAAWLAKHGG